jgi:hypothetical protein
VEAIAGRYSAAAGAGPCPAFAATINVTGGCTLVDAITAANTDNPVGACTGGAEADTLVLPPGSNQTLTAVNNTTPYGPTGLPVITSAITISGNAATIRRVSTNDFRIFAVPFDGNLTLRQTTVSGGRFTGGFVGGGVYNNGTFNLTQSTISGNSARSDVGGVLNRGALTMIHDTISDNSALGVGEGVGNDGNLTLDSTLISGNTAPSGREVYNRTPGTIAANNFNLFGFNGNAGVIGFTPGPNDVVPAVGVTLAEILDGLGDNGGTTPTHALVAGSPALNAIGAGCPPPLADQRAITRPQGVRCDVGSFELEGGVPPPPPPGPPPTTVTCNSQIATRVGSANSEILNGTAGRDVINGQGGNDTIVGKRGNNTICGGRGNDRLNGGKGVDQCNGGGGSGDTAAACKTRIGVP